MSEADNGGPGRREVAYRLFATEFEAADYSFSESNEERAPNYVVTPTGARANRVFVVGVLTEIEQVSEDVLRARVVDPTGAFVLYAGQYQPDEQAFLGRAEPPMFVAVTGKARTFSPDDSEQVFTSIRPESISEVDADTRDRWVVQTASHTLDRIYWMATALLEGGEHPRQALEQRGVEDGLAHGIELALDHYGSTPSYLDGVRRTALDATRVVAGELEEVEPRSMRPGDAGETTVGDLLASLPDEPLALKGVSGSTTTSTAGGTDPGEQADDGETAQTGESAETTTDADEFETAEESTETAGVETPTSTTSEPDRETSEETTQAASTEAGESESSTAETSDTVESAESAEPLTAGADSETDELGDFEPGEFDNEEFDLEEETREQIESEYGTEFQSGAEVDDPGNADIDTPEPDTPAEDAEGTATEPVSEEAAAETAEQAPTSEETEETEETTAATPEDAGATTDTTPEDTGETTDEAPEEAEETTDDAPEDTQDAVVSLMEELDSGSGAERATVIAEMESRYGIGSDEVEDAIQSALMAGQCYEPDDDRLKSI